MLFRSIDGLKKIGEAKVRESLLANQSLSEEEITRIMDFVSLSGSADEQLKKLSVMDGNELFKKGVEELSEVVKGIRLFGVPDENFAVDLKIVRGLDYYTGTVYETFLEGHEGIGSVCSGGRYDNLAGFYTDKPLPGVGISIGLTRLFDKLCDMLEQTTVSVSKVLVLSPDGTTLDTCIQAAAELRAQGIRAQVYLEDGKAKTKFKYADRLSIPYCLIIGETEKAAGTVTLKNMTEGKQQEGISLAEAIELLKDKG